MFTQSKQVKYSHEDGKMLFGKRIDLAATSRYRIEEDARLAPLIQLVDVNVNYEIGDQEFTFKTNATARRNATFHTAMGSSGKFLEIEFKELIDDEVARMLFDEGFNPTEISKLHLCFTIKAEVDENGIAFAEVTKLRFMGTTDTVKKATNARIKLQDTSWYHLSATFI
ncbi:hypothetical protein SM033_00193 [Vibrio phage vB_VpaM_sm033]|nr:hypothetical protein SM033_00193 [Vibrio phage vB_VpaM_sm033]